MPATSTTLTTSLSSATPQATGTAAAGVGNSASRNDHIHNLAVASQATGDIMYFNGTSWVRLPIGSTNQLLNVTGGVPAWSTGAGMFFDQEATPSASSSTTLTFNTTARRYMICVALSKATNGIMQFQINGITTGTYNYAQQSNGTFGTASADTKVAMNGTTVNGDWYSAVIFLEIGGTSGSEKIFYHCRAQHDSNTVLAADGNNTTTSTTLSSITILNDAGTFSGRITAFRLADA